MNTSKSESSPELKSESTTPESESNPRTHPGSDLVDGSPQDIPTLRSRQLMSRVTAALLVIDVQEKLVPHIPHQSTIIWNIRRLIDGAALLNVPVMCTEQYPKGLGHTVPLLAERLSVDDEKSLFSCRDCHSVIRRLQESKCHQVLLCGIESHVCVQQTALDLIAMGFDVWVAVDAIGSRFELDHETAIRRMQSAGVSITTTESALFEWCEVSGTHEFKRISTLVQESPPQIADIPDARYFPRPASRYIVQSDHYEVPAGAEHVDVTLRYLVRNTATGNVAVEFTGKAKRNIADPSQVSGKEGTQSVEITADGTAVSVQQSDGSIEMVYLQMGDARTNHPRWKVRRTERHIASEEYVNDYEITIQVVEYKTDSTFREFQGYEHRVPETGGYTHVSGVRQVEVSSDGRWMVVTELGRPQNLIALPAE